MLGVLET